MNNITLEFHKPEDKLPEIGKPCLLELDKAGERFVVRRMHVVIGYQESVRTNWGKSLHSYDGLSDVHEKVLRWASLPE